MITKAAKHICKIICLHRKIVKYTVCTLICMKYAIRKMNDNKYRINLVFFYKKQISSLLLYQSLQIYCY